MRNAVAAGAFGAVFTAISALSAVAGDAPPEIAPDKPTLALSTKGADSGLFATLFGVPSAIAAPSGTAFAAVNYTDPRGGVAGSGGDGDLSFGVSFGNPVTGIGVTAGVDITGLDPLGDAGSFSLQASRLLGITENSATFLGASYSGLLGWGAGADQEKASVYLTHFRTFDLGGSPVPVLGTIGYGQNVRYTGYNTGVMENGLFWGAGVGVSSFLSASLSGTDNQLNAGVGIRIPGLERVSISAGYYDVTDNVGRRQASVTVGYGISDIFGGF